MCASAERKQGSFGRLLVQGPLKDFTYPHLASFSPLTTWKWPTISPFGMCLAMLFQNGRLHVVAHPPDALESFKLREVNIEVGTGPAGNHVEDDPAFAIRDYRHHPDPLEVLLVDAEERRHLNRSLDAFSRTKSSNTFFTVTWDSGYSSVTSLNVRCKERWAMST